MKKTKIKTVGDLKRILNEIDSSLPLFVGTRQVHFQISSYNADGPFLGLSSNDLQEYLDKKHKYEGDV